MAGSVTRRPAPPGSSVRVWPPPDSERVTVPLSCPSSRTGPNGVPSPRSSGRPSSTSPPAWSKPRWPPVAGSRRSKPPPGRGAAWRPVAPLGSSTRWVAAPWASKSVCTRRPAGVPSRPVSGRSSATRRPLPSCEWVVPSRVSCRSKPPPGRGVGCSIGSGTWWESSTRWTVPFGVTVDSTRRPLGPAVPWSARASTTGCGAGGCGWTCCAWMCCAWTCCTGGGAWTCCGGWTAWAGPCCGAGCGASWGCWPTCGGTPPPPSEPPSSRGRSRRLSAVSAARSRSIRAGSIPRPVTRSRAASTLSAAASTDAWAWITTGLGREPPPGRAWRSDSRRSARPRSCRARVRSAQASNRAPRPGSSLAPNSPATRSPCSRQSRSSWAPVSCSGPVSRSGPPCPPCPPVAGTVGRSCADPAAGCAGPTGGSGAAGPWTSGAAGGSGVGVGVGVGVEPRTAGGSGAGAAGTGTASPWTDPCPGPGPGWSRPSASSTRPRPPCAPAPPRSVTPPGPGTPTSAVGGVTACTGGSTGAGVAATRGAANSPRCRLTWLAARARVLWSPRCPPAVNTGASARFSGEPVASRSRAPFRCAPEPVVPRPGTVTAPVTTDGRPAPPPCRAAVGRVPVVRCGTATADGVSRSAVWTAGAAGEAVCSAPVPRAAGAPPVWCRDRAWVWRFGVWTVAVPPAVRVSARCTGAGVGAPVSPPIPCRPPGAAPAPSPVSTCRPPGVTTVPPAQLPTGCRSRIGVSSSASSRRTASGAIERRSARSLCSRKSDGRV